MYIIIWAIIKNAMKQCYKNTRVYKYISTNFLTMEKRNYIYSFSFIILRLHCSKKVFVGLVNTHNCGQES